MITQSPFSMYRALPFDPNLHQEVGVNWLFLH